MRTLRPFVIGAFAIATLSVIAYGLFQKDGASMSEPAGLVLLGAGLFASAQARRHVVKS